MLLKWGGGGGGGWGEGMMYIFKYSAPKGAKLFASMSIKE